MSSEASLKRKADEAIMEAVGEQVPAEGGGEQGLPVVEGLGIIPQGEAVIPPPAAAAAAPPEAAAPPAEQQAMQEEAAGKPPPAKKRRVVKKRGKGRPWNDMLYQLLLFRAKHGHCRVPGSKGALGAWVVQQRQQYHAIKAKRAQEAAAAAEKQAAVPLEGIADVEPEPDKKPKASVPMSPADLERKSQALNEERIQVLDTIEFVWDVVQFDNDVRWNLKYEELKEFVRINGHAVVPQSTQLGQWVKMQRENKKEADLKAAGMRPKRAKQRPCLSKEREEKLEAVGFQWKVAKTPVGWERRYEQLVEYQRVHGDCNVPQSYPPDKSFGRWVMKQRCEYSLKLRSLKSQLTDEREARLNAIGFSWVAPNFKRKTVPADDLAEDVIGRGDEAAIAMLAGNSVQM